MSQQTAVPQLSLPDKFDLLELKVKGKVFERPWEIRTGLVGLIARRHQAQIGAPGVGKTWLVDVIISFIEGLDPHKNYFHTQLTPFSTPPDVNGALSLKGLEQDIIRYNTAGMLPEAAVAFLDEGFNGNSAMLNSLLGMMNEGIFFNGGSPTKIPLGTIFFGSNVMPVGPELAAMADRVSFWHKVEGVKEMSNFAQMARDKCVPRSRRLAANDPVITWDEVLQAQEEADEIEVSELVIEKLCELKIALGKKGIFPTDRHMMDCIPIVKAQAWRNRRPIADLEDMRLLRFAVCNDFTQFATVKNIVIEICNPMDAEANELLDLIEGYALEAAKLQGSAGDVKAQTVAIELKDKLARAEERLDQMMEEAKKSPSRTEVVEDAKARVTAVTDGLLFDLFGIKP